MPLPPLSPSLPEFRELATQGNLIPVWCELLADAETPVSAFQKLDSGGYSFLLESAENSAQAGRYSFVGTDPALVIETLGNTVRITEHSQTREFVSQSDPLTELENLLSVYRRVKPPGLDDITGPSFTGGAVGFLSYNAVRFFEPSVGEPQPDPLALPDALFFLTDAVLIFDHRSRRMRVLVNAHVPSPEDADAAYTSATTRVGDILARLAQPAALPQLPVPKQPAIPAEARCNTTREEYMATVSACQEYIRAGDIFQIVPSQRFETEYTGDALTLYRTLRDVNPSPYMFCLNLAGRFSLVGSSPEVHVRVTGGRVDIRPIAGTKRRGSTPSEDDANAADLLADPKERAEHLMLVDLARNDVGRISKFGSVKVSDFMTIERYSHVMHIVSHVEGELSPDKSAFDVMRATFPAGTVSGSPKIRAMQLLNQFEKHKRGVYAGAVGYFGFDGNTDSCIALRTVVLKDGHAYVQTGAGVVADSTPEGEHQECVNKAMGMMAAIARARSTEPANH
ncbi:MAG: anthranilate synthase component I [Chthoniobacteraceae bacterium]|nr:anthranilate synthase component I [Chthoniobacteraceae bacterium]NBV32921.1 anthranilate synthase component I [Pseudomonadota bacterium]